jgi:hypothetical protein
MQATKQLYDRVMKNFPETKKVLPISSPKWKELVELSENEDELIEDLKRVELGILSKIKSYLYQQLGKSIYESMKNHLEN